MPAKNNLLNRDGPIEVIPSHELKVLFAWRAPSRPYKRRDKEFWTTVGAIVFLLGVILILIEEWLAILLIASIVFFVYAFSTVPPDEIEIQITNRGIRFAGKEYLWEQFSSFWVEEKWNHQVINFVLTAGIIKCFRLVAPEKDVETVKTILGKYLPNEQMPPSFSDKALNWFSEKIPLDLS